MDRESSPVLIFDAFGPYAHYKRIFATTSAMTYPIPTKTAIYGLLGAIIGLEKEANAYLRHFREGDCRIALQLINSVRTQRMTINLRPDFGSNSATPSTKKPLRESGNRKPTLTEFVHRPRYRLYVSHADQDIYARLRRQLENGRSVFTPTLGLANCLATLGFIAEATAEPLDTDSPVVIDSVIPKSRLQRLSVGDNGPNRLMEVGQYAVEMTPSRDVTVRDDIILDRDGKPIAATVERTHLVTWNNERAHVVFF